MEPQFWQNRWRNGQIGFHQPSVDRSLERHWPALNLGPSSRGSAPRVFVPLCGKSLDLLWLRDQGHVVTGVELSATALEAFCMENGIPARRRIQDDFDVYEAGNLELYRTQGIPVVLDEQVATLVRAFADRSLVDADQFIAAATAAGARTQAGAALTRTYLTQQLQPVAPRAEHDGLSVQMSTVYG